MLLCDRTTCTYTSSLHDQINSTSHRASESSILKDPNCKGLKHHDDTVLGLELLDQLRPEVPLRSSAAGSTVLIASGCFKCTHTALKGVSLTAFSLSMRQRYLLIMISYRGMRRLCRVRACCTGRDGVCDIFAGYWALGAGQYRKSASVKAVLRFLHTCHGAPNAAIAQWIGCAFWNLPQGSGPAEQMSAQSCDESWPRQSGRNTSERYLRCCSHVMNRAASIKLSCVVQLGSAGAGDVGSVNLLDSTEG